MEGNVDEVNDGSVDGYSVGLIEGTKEVY